MEAARGIQTQGMRRRPMQTWVSCSGVGQLPAIHTPWVAISVVSSVAPTLSTAQHNNVVLVDVQIVVVCLHPRNGNGDQQVFLMKFCTI